MKLPYEDRHVALTAQSEVNATWRVLRLLLCYCFAPGTHTKTNIGANDATAVEGADRGADRGTDDEGRH